MRKLLAVGVVVLSIYIYLALHAPKVFDVLVYDESELMPQDIEPVVVSSIVKDMKKGGEEVHPVVIFGPDLEEKARALSMLYPNAVTPWTILDKALELYWENVWKTVENYTSKFREAALQFSN
ncbi:MAG: MMPL family transporter, partial [Pyrobaculum sp.]